MKTALKVGVGLALSALTFYFFLGNLDLERVRAGLAHANWPVLLAAIFLGYFGHLTLRSLRWGLMLQPLKKNAGRLSFYNLFSTTAIGYAVSWLTPGRIGEIVRPLLLARREALPGASAIATVGLERLLDAVTVLVLASVSALSAPIWAPERVHDPVLEAARWLGVAGLIGSALGLLVLRGLVRENSGFLRFLSRKQEASGGLARHVWTFARHLAEGATFLRDGARSSWIAMHSLLIWGTIGLSIWMGLLAAGVRIPFVGVFMLLALSVIGIAVPTPGGAGSVHLAFQQGLIGLFGVEPNLASVATVLYHPVMVYIPPVVFGLLFAWRDGASFRSLKSLAGRAEPSGGTGGLGGDGVDGVGGGTGPAGQPSRDPAGPETPCASGGRRA